MSILASAHHHHHEVADHAADAAFLGSDATQGISTTSSTDLVVEEVAAYCSDDEVATNKDEVDKMATDLISFARRCVPENSSYLLFAADQADQALSRTKQDSAQQKISQNLAELSLKRKETFESRAESAARSLKARTALKNNSATTPPNAKLETSCASLPIPFSLFSSNPWRIAWMGSGARCSARRWRSN